MELGIIVLGIILIFAIKSIYDRKVNYKKMLERLKEQWGRLPKEEYTYEEFKSLESYYLSVKEVGKDIDNITWNDVNMDDIFMMMNNTSCAIGEEYLYSVLRKVKDSEEELVERNRLISLFQEKPTERLKLQAALKEMGKLQGISVFEYITRLNSLEVESNTPHIIMILGLIFSIILIPFNPLIGGVLCFLFIANNIYRYYKAKAKVDSLFAVCGYFVRLLHSVKMISRINIPEIKTYTDKLVEGNKKFIKFQKGSFIVAVKNPNGDIMDTMLDYVRMLFHVDLIKFNTMLSCFKKNYHVLCEIYETIGTLDSMIAVASFRTMLDYYSIPELKRDTKPFYKAEELFHPMLSEPVTNSIDESRCVVITGSNASGKSTFIKTLAINAILAQTIYTSISRNYKASFFQIASSMALQDNILSSESYYIVEIKSLKRILDLINSEIPTLCFVDEVLRGTNTLERIAASSQILLYLSKVNVMCFAATHDIELTHILEKNYSNYHFQEQIIENNVLFDYKLIEGRSISRNAIKLLEVIGYPEEVIEKASGSASHFLSEGNWEVVN